MLAQELRHGRQILDARADIEHLAAAIALAQDCLAHDHRIERQDECAHRQPVHRRRRDQAHLPHAREGKLQRARDRRRRQRQHVHLGAELLQLLLVLHAEMLLLVDHHEAEPLERHALAEQRVGADRDVDGSIRKPLLDPRRFLAGDKARELRDLERQVAEALDEALIVLARK
jgi:hypothetical protein